MLVWQRSPSSCTVCSQFNGMIKKGQLRGGPSIDGSNLIDGGCFGEM